MTLDAIVIVAVVIIVGVVLYLKKHPDAVAGLEDKIKAEFDKLHSKVDSVHAAALAPVTVAVVQAPAPVAATAAPSTAIAVAQAVAQSNANILQALLGSDSNPNAAQILDARAAEPVSTAINKDPTKGMWGGDCPKGQTLYADPFVGDGSTRSVVMNDPGNSLGVKYLLNGDEVRNGQSLTLTQGVQYALLVSYDGSNPHHPDVARIGIWLRK